MQSDFSTHLQEFQEVPKPLMAVVSIVLLSLVSSCPKILGTVYSMGRFKKKKTFPYLPAFSYPFIFIALHMNEFLQFMHLLCHSYHMLSLAK